MQFITQGPQIPENVIQALNNDNLVLFCGSGISMNNSLPSFKGLVKTVCKKLHININQNPLLKEAMEQKNYDIMLDLIESGQDFSVGRTTLRKEVIIILDNFKDEVDTHKSLLELSALPNNKGYRVVTTNFDRLFFEAGLKSKFSDSAPKLAPPRKETWKNLTFLHGVIDEEHDPEGDNLILTRRDFGLAYLYDNWATRFIIQLFQDFNVLFIGYSVDDPIMNYLISAISYENKRREENKIKKNTTVKPSIYTFAGHEKNQETKIKNEWKALGVKPILYKKTESNDHSLLYETIKKWAKSKKTGLAGRRNWLKRQLEQPYREETDGQTAETVISALKMDEKLAEYLPAINLSSDSEKRKPVDISWLKAFAEETKESKSNRFPSPIQTVKTKNSLLEKLTQQAAQSSNYSWWEPLSPTERNIAEWLLHHLDKKELIHWLIKKSSHRRGLVSLHPEFKSMIEIHLRYLQTEKKDKQELDQRIKLFWNILLTQKDESNFGVESVLISELNKEYTYTKARKLLTILEPQIGFETYFFTKERSKIEGRPDLIYEPKLKISMNGFLDQLLENEKALLTHAEDFTNLLKKAMEFAKFAGIIQNEHDLFYFQKPSIAPHEQNRNYDSWTYLIDLVRDSFDLAMKKNKKLAKFLIDKWQFYPYSIFYRLILYAVKKYPDLDEDMAIKLFEEKPDQTLWSSSCKNELLKFLKNRNHSKKSIKKILSLIMKGPSRSLYREDIEDSLFTEIKERAIYQKLHNLKTSGIELPKDIEDNYNKIQSKYSFKPSTEKGSDKEDFPFWHSGATWSGDEKRYHNQTCEKTFEEIKHTKPNTPPHLTNKTENFRILIKDHPDKAYKILLMFKDQDISSYPYWSIFISEVSMMTDAKKSNSYFLKSFQKIENFENGFFKKYLWSLIHGFNMKGGLIYFTDKERFKKWWNKLWSLSMKDDNYSTYSDVSGGALNSHLGKLSQSIFYILWSHFSDRKMKKNEKLPEEIKAYFKVIIKQGSLKDSSVLYHFGSYLWDLWSLDKEWVKTNLIELMDWSQKENLCKAFWTGWLYHPKWCPDFLYDFKNEIFQLILNRKKFYKTNQKNVNEQEFCENIASILFIATGGREVKNIFTDEELKKLIQSMDTNILESLSRQIWQVLEDSGDKSSNLWSEKIKPWIENFWPPQTKLQTSKIAENLSNLILCCGDKLPEAFNILKDKIGGMIQNNNDYISRYIIRKMDKELKYVFGYPEELLQILNWNFPKDQINQYMGGKEITKILEKLKQNYPEIEKNPDYKKLSEKLL